MPVGMEVGPEPPTSLQYFDAVGWASGRASDL